MNSKKLPKFGKLRFETLEQRMLLSVTQAEYMAMNEEFSLDLPAWESSEAPVNLIEVGGDGYALSVEGLQEALDEAAETTGDDLIVVRTAVGQEILNWTENPQNRGSMLALESTRAETVSIVAWGDTGLTLDAYERGRVLDVLGTSTAVADTLTLKLANITFSNGFTTDDGAGIRADNANLLLSSCMVWNNFAGNSGEIADSDGFRMTSGGGIAFGHDSESSSTRGLQLTVYNSILSNNEVYQGCPQDEGGNTFAYGGGISAVGDVLISDSKITWNTVSTAMKEGASAYGGGVYVYGEYGAGGSLVLANCSVTDNSVRGAGATGGGGVYFEGNRASVTDCDISYNYLEGADAYGGGAGLYAKSLNVTTSDFSHNKIQAWERGETPSVGGGGFAHYGAVESSLIVGVSCRGNVVSTASGNAYGGGMYAESSMMGLVEDSWFEFNSVTGVEACGGGVCSDTEMNAHYKNLTIQNNTASAGTNGGSAYGAGFYADARGQSENLLLSGCVIAGNVGAGHDALGGGVYLQKYNKSNDNLCVVTNSTISNNMLRGTGFDHWTNGAGLFAYDMEGTVLLNSSIVASNGDLWSSSEIRMQEVGSFVGTNNLTAPFEWSGTSADNVRYDWFQPLFSNDWNRDYTVLPGSQAIGKGKILTDSAIWEKFTGADFPTFAKPDIGAIQQDYAATVDLYDGTIQVAWDAVPGAEGYVVSYKLSNAKRWISRTVWDATSYAFRPAAGKSYDIFVETTDGDVVYESTTSFVVPSNLSLRVPKSEITDQEFSIDVTNFLTKRANLQNNVNFFKVTWQDSGESMWVSAEGGQSAHIGELWCEFDPTTGTLLFTGAQPSGRYNLGIQAVCMNGEQYSVGAMKCAAAVTAKQAFLAPSAVQAEVLGYNSVHVGWTQSVVRGTAIPATTYTVQYSSNSGRTWRTATTKATLDGWTISNLKPNANYQFRVFATKSKEYSASDFSPAAAARTWAKLPAITISGRKEIARTSVEFTISNLDKFAGCDYYLTVNGQTWTEAELDFSTRKLTVSGLNSGTTCKFELEFVLPDSVSPASSPVKKWSVRTLR